MLESKDVFEEKLDRLFRRQNKSEIEIILECVSLIIYSTINNTDIVELYRLLDLADFVKVISLFDGRTVKFPTKTELRSSLLLAVLYYYREILNMDWDEIKEEFPFEISSISYGIQIKNLNNFIKQKMYEMFKKMDKEEIKKNISSIFGEEEDG